LNLTWDHWPDEPIEGRGFVDDQPNTFRAASTGMHSNAVVKKSWIFLKRPGRRSRFREGRWGRGLERFGPGSFGSEATSAAINRSAEILKAV
ncbi:MAG: hypothetical protein PHN90_02040, partial [Methanothrix sp.]|nr:hypothetical protein [Methanothrix sp.]